MPENTKDKTLSEKKNNILKDIKHLLSILGKYKVLYIIFMLLSSIIGSFMTIIAAETMRSLVSFFVDKDGSITVTRLIVLIASMTFYRLVIGQLINYVISILQIKMEADIRKRLFWKLQSMPVGYFHGSHSGDFVAKMNLDVTSVSKAADTLWDGAYTIINMAFIIPYFMSLDWRLSVVVIALGILFSIFINLVVRPMRKRSKDILKSMSEMSMTTTESVTGFNVTKMFLLQDKFSKDFSDGVDTIYENQKKYGNLSAWIGFSQMVITYGGRAAIGIFGLIFAFNGTLDVSVLAGMLTVYYNIIDSFINVGSVPSDMQKYFASSDRLYDLFNTSSEPERYEIGGTDPEAGVLLKDVEFEYNDGMPVLKGVSICAKKGEMIALVGDSGSGKTTLVKLLAGLYAANKGEIVVNGRGLSDYTLTELRQSVAYVPQDAYVFNGSIKENISYGKDNPTDDEIILSAKEANADTFIMEKPDGYETQVGERGIQLSGGERQRVAIARAILKNAPLLLLDEATSSLDSETELAIQATLEKLMKGRTSVVVAHRLSTIINADRIYFMREGKVVDSGSHKELLEKCRDYSDLFYKNFEKVAVS
ncbi:MAG TPA: ABC transporter ATP-binding protein [Oscillospiraceae bacterium]|nr:ABC transporter ATP-binding protein [Oscillospiraceae bacterium]HPF56387.1 ABC transporter ATP-binding protein [Clostridiales bacterium]HPK34921.1 ABC transporter ATP-binding protein [Oscillospiraceae bacterium]HPR75370.1 ABC transporter ATP-binding protein [Oscillospiraceae bacterium]